MQRSAETLATANAAETAAAVSNRKVSALEATEAAIARIEALDGPINAVVVRDFDRARDQAKKVDSAIRKGADLPLAGVPMTVKEVYNRAGLPTTFGLMPAKDYRPTDDAPTIRRLESAGAVILGKTNVATGLADYQSDNLIYGRTNNPHNLAYTPGGSSGGSAAVLAAGMVPLELGSDAGGSTRVPAAFCGVFGHLSSFGIASLEGHGPPGGGIRVGMHWAAGGPMARTAADLELALGVLAGPEGRDAKGYQLVLPAARHARLSGYRVFVLPNHPYAVVDNEIVSAIEDLAAQLERKGAAVTRQSELLPDFVESFSLVEEFSEVGRARMPSPGAPPSKATVKDVYDCLTAQEVLRRKWDAFFKCFDVVIAPVFPTAAFPHTDEPDFQKRMLRINGVDAPFPFPSPWPMIALIAHLPATAAPIGWTKSGLPIGAQIIGPFLEDLTTIRFAGLIEAEFGITAKIATAAQEVRERGSR
jgi:amidase